MVSLLRCFALTALISFSFNAQAALQFAKKKISVGNKTFVVEIAESTPQHERGLMFINKLAEDEGMLFIFKNEETRFFWMKNTMIDLSIGFFDKDKTLVDVQEMKSGQNVSDADLPSYASARPAKYALEMNKGWFDKNKIKIGSKLKIH
ncbi:DUF192 domain-containing protein [Bdellovibrio sp. NC01]|uniref:DUF192 domain-containing protein n=1 Tax=Bdellovibrio sp. NC01 TaxID=2220073 RepID=UPI00115BA86C|nr:DUF192 domain-containing protein [Bdellovibrio sp. NC01]QDK36153.1 DUF192 domain-containing protein [Bdellovibrio sp. NC01]